MLLLEHVAREVGEQGVRAGAHALGGDPLRERVEQALHEGERAQAAEQRGAGEDPRDVAVLEQDVPRRLAGTWW